MKTKLLPIGAMVGYCLSCLQLTSAVANPDYKTNHGAGEEVHLVIEIESTAQMRVSGKVTGGEGEGLPGVNILVKNTTGGTVTDVEGNYSLQAPEDGILVFSIGYLSRDVPVNNLTTINVESTADVSQLKEIVVVGYGEQKEENLTGAVSTVNFDRTLEN